MFRFYIALSTLFCLSIIKLSGQDDRRIQLTLERAIVVAQDSSLKAFIDKNEYLSDYWDYRTYQAEFLPTLRLQTMPFNYERAVREVYNSQEQRFQFIQNESLTSYANLSLTQNIPFTGGRIYIDSDLGRIQNIGGKTEFSSTPVRIGIRQGLFNFNWLKWEKKTEPIEFERAKREYFQSAQEIANQTVDRFFDLLFAQISLNMAQIDYANADTLYTIGLSRKDSISLEDLYSLELSLMVASSNLERAQSNTRRAQTRLLSFLRLDKNLQIELIPPDEIPYLVIEESMALQLARKNNPDMLTYRLRRIEADRWVEQTRKSRYSADLSVSLGLNRTLDDDEFLNLYQNLDNQQRVEIKMNIPIMDWGLSEKRYNLAKSDREVVMARMEQEEIDFEEDVKRTVEDFNMQKQLVKRSAMADTLAQMMYEVTQKRYLAGEVDIVKLNSAQNKKNEAREDYFKELKKYWDYFYEIQELTLYDFVNRNELFLDFEEIMKGNGL